MAIDYSLPPEPRKAILKRIYPWDEYDANLVMSWLYLQAQKTGFTGTIDDFKLRYGKFIEITDPQDIQDLIENYVGTYHITPMVELEQILKTKNRMLNENIIIDPIPEEFICHHRLYDGNYEVIPRADEIQLIPTKNKVMENNITVQKIPYSEIDNDAGGRTVAIG